jgi:hypothetical protein
MIEANAFADLPKSLSFQLLKRIYLEDNKIRVVDVATFGTLSLVGLHGNPISDGEKARVRAHRNVNFMF